MPQKKHKPEEIVAKLRQVDVLVRINRHMVNRALGLFLISDQHILAV